MRERGLFWSSAPSRTLMAAIILDMTFVAVLVMVGIPGVAPIPPTYLALEFSYVLALSLAVNDRVKHDLIRRFGIGA